MTNSMDVMVRSARHQDISAITGMARSLAGALGLPANATDKDAIAQLLFGSDRWAEAFVAVDREQNLVGYMALCRRFEPHNGARSLWLGDIYVMQSARRRGVGEKLLKAAAKRAVTLKCTALAWGVDFENEEARAFFERQPGGRNGRVEPWVLEGRDLSDAAQD